MSFIVAGPRFLSVRFYHYCRPFCRPHHSLFCKSGRCYSFFSSIRSYISAQRKIRCHCLLVKLWVLCGGLPRHRSTLTHRAYLFSWTWHDRRHRSEIPTHGVSSQSDRFQRRSRRIRIIWLSRCLTSDRSARRLKLDAKAGESQAAQHRLSAQKNVIV